MSKKSLLTILALATTLHAAPAAADIKLGGDAAVRFRSMFKEMPNSIHTEDVLYQYRVRLKADADLGRGYYFKTILMSENDTGGWNSVSYGNTEAIALSVNKFHIGRQLDDSSYRIGRIPADSFSDPLLDLAMYPAQPLCQPVLCINFDRFSGAGYTRKLGPGELSTTLLVIDDRSNDGLFNDGYGLRIGYKTTIASVTINPQLFTSLTNMDTYIQNNNKFSDGSPTGLTVLGDGVTPLTFGAALRVPAGKGAISCYGYYTTCSDTGDSGRAVDYSGYLFRVKADYGPAMALLDYSETETGAIDYRNIFLRAKYAINVHSSASGKFDIVPTLRWMHNWESGETDTEKDVIVPELWAVISF